MPRLCASSPDAITAAVAALALGDGDDGGGGAAATAAAEAALGAGLRDLSSGLLAAEAPALVNATVAAALPALTDARIAAGLDWRALLAASGDPRNAAAAAALAFFAARAAAALSTNLDLSPARAGDANAGGVLVGTLGEATRLLQACATLLESGFDTPRPRLPDATLADLAFACERVAASGAADEIAADAGSGGGSGAEMRGVVAVVVGEAHAVASALRARLPGAARHSPTASALLARLWREDGAASRGALRRRVAAALRVEDAAAGGEAALARRALAPAARVLRALVDGIDGEDLAPAVVAPVLAVALPAACGFSAARRLDALAVIARVLEEAPDTALSAAEPGVIVSAVTDAMSQDDTATVLQAVPLLERALPLLYSPVTLSAPPPPAWDAALAAILRALTSRIAADKRVEDADPATADADLLTAAALALHIPRVAQARLTRDLGSVLSPLCDALAQAGRAVGRRGTDFVPAFAALAEALVETLRAAWPRVPPHVEALLRAAAVAVLSARGAPEQDVARVVDAAASVLVWTARCGQRARFDAIVRGVRGTVAGRASLAVVLRLLDAVDAQLAADAEASGGGGGDAGDDVADAGGVGADATVATASANAGSGDDTDFAALRRLGLRLESRSVSETV